MHEDAIARLREVIGSYERTGHPIGASSLIIDHGKALLALADAVKWQPIETAPKDGSRLMLLWPVGMFSTPSIEFGKWNDDRYARKPRPYWTGERALNTTAYRAHPPTHWKPEPSSLVALPEGE